MIPNVLVLRTRFNTAELVPLVHIAWRTHGLRSNLLPQSMHLHAVDPLEFDPPRPPSDQEIGQHGQRISRSTWPFELDTFRPADDDQVVTDSDMVIEPDTRPPHLRCSAFRQAIYKYDVSPRRVGE